MKPIALAISLLLSSVAFAQTPATSASPASASTAAAPLVTAPVGGQDVTPSVSGTPGVFNREVNPFTGKPLSGEELQARLEASRILTSSLEEQLKQVTLAGEISTLPVRKSAEVAAARLSVRSEELKLQALDDQAKEAARQREAALQAEKEAKAAAKRAAAQAAKEAARLKAMGPAAEQGVQMAAPVIPRATLLSVMKVGGQMSAMLDFGGATLLVGDGEMTPIGPLKFVDHETVDISGTVLKVSSATISRFANPAVMVTSANRAATTSGRAPGASSAGAPVAGGARGSAADAQAPGFENTGPSSLVPPGVPAGRAAAVASEAAAVTGLSGTAARLPPLQLPPGISVMPSR